MLNSESFNDTTETFTLSNTNNINVLVLAKDISYSDFFFEECSAVVNLLLGIFASIDLDLENVVFLL